MDRLDDPTRALVVLAAAIAGGQAGRLEAAIHGVLGDAAWGPASAAPEGGAPGGESAGAGAAAGAAAVRQVWVEELVLQSVLMVGWPRALIAAEAWRRISGRAPASVEEGGDYHRHAAWEDRGEAVCRVIYGRNYERLRANVRALHPTLERWMLVDGYGRTIGRPGLDLARRELCVVAQVAVQGAERQLHSHLRGALNAGASVGAVAEALAIAAAHSGSEERAVAKALWDRIRG